MAQDPGLTMDEGVVPDQKGTALVSIWADLRQADTCGVALKVDIVPSGRLEKNLDAAVLPASVAVALALQAET